MSHINYKRADPRRWNYPDDWFVMEIGKSPPPGTPIATSCWLPYEQIKHLLSDVPLARPGDPWPPTARAAKRTRAKRRRA
jgi:hypothetical protein